MAAVNPESLTLRAPAKLNLFLEVTGRRPDGYHTLESVMQSVSLADTLVITRRAEGCSLRCACLTGDTLPTDASNLVLRAAERFFAVSGVRGGADFHLTKRIPVCAGLGGGSTDAAAALRGLDALYRTALPRQTLLEMAASLGADVPFCLEGGCCLAHGIGELLHPIRGLPSGCRIAIAIGDERVSTPQAFRALDERGERRCRDVSGMLDCLEAGTLSEIGGALYNAFEACAPHGEEIRRVLRDADARGVLMSGSGPAVFGLFETDAPCAQACETLREKGYYACEASPL